MKNNLSNAQRWLRQAAHDLKIAEHNFNDGFYSDACFMSEQASQKALKAFLFFGGERFVPMHSLTALVSEAVKKDKEFENLRDPAKILDKYYIPTRYPDALPMPAVPFEEYDAGDAQEAIDCAKAILNLAADKARDKEERAR